MKRESQQRNKKLHKRNICKEEPNVSFTVLKNTITKRNNQSEWALRAQWLEHWKEPVNHNKKRNDLNRRIIANDLTFHIIRVLEKRGKGQD